MPSHERPPCLRPTDLLPLPSAFILSVRTNHAFSGPSLLLLLCDRIVFGYFSGLVGVVWGHIEVFSVGVKMVAHFVHVK